MRPWKFVSVMAAAALGLYALSVQAAAPPPSKPVDLQRYYGRWYEVARVPNRFERGSACDAPTADYDQDANGSVTVVQTCHAESPSGPAKVYRAAAHILDPGVNAKFRLTFFLLLSRDYWVLDHAPDYSWAIVGDPTGKYVWLFSRRPILAPATKTALIARTKALGYDVDKLEFPNQS
jgi:apolipoprotein D and lipocalin family protein